MVYVPPVVRMRPLGRLARKEYRGRLPWRSIEDAARIRDERRQARRNGRARRAATRAARRDAAA